MKRVLVITYYWPPSGGAGVHRWLKFSKFLPEYGWKPVVYTPENPEAPADDPSLEADIHPEAEVIKRPIWEPYQLYKKFMGLKPGSRVNAGFLNEQSRSQKKEGISVWIRGNLFIPDARKFWVKPSVRFLKTYLRDNPVDAIISTGPPHSLHLIALEISRHFEVPWLADFRDPWTEIDFYHQLRLTARSDRKQHEQEKAVLLGADRVVVVTQTMAERFQETSGIEALVVPNGYDEADFNMAPPKPDKTFTLVHVGAMNRDRNHEIFWEALSELIREIPEQAPDIQVKLVGKLDHSVHESLDRHKLHKHVSISTYLPHNQVALLLKSASALYLPINNTPGARGILTGKLFEYLAAERPILGIGPCDGDTAGIMEECHAGNMVGFTDKAGVKSLLKEWIHLNAEGRLKAQTSGIEKYRRRNLSSSLAAELDKLTQKPVQQ